MPRSAAIDDYVRRFPPQVRAILRKVRATVRRAAPHAEEIISYRMPALRQNGILIYYAAFKGHIGLFPPVRGNARLMKSAAKYAGPKGNLRFPYDRPIPFGLIARVVTCRVNENRGKGRGGNERGVRERGKSLRREATGA